MKNLIVIAFSMVILSGISFAITNSNKPELPRDGQGQKIQACAPTIKNDVALTGNSQTINVTDANCWAGFVAADTKFRVMSTTTKVGIQHTIPSGSWHSESVSNYKYVNFSTVGGVGTFRSDKP